MTGAQRSDVRFIALGRDAATSCSSPPCREGCAEGGENIAHKFSIPFGFMVLLSLYMRNLVSVLFFEISLL